MKTIGYNLELLQSFLSDVLKLAFSISNYRHNLLPPLNPPFKLEGTCPPTSYGCAALGGKQIRVDQGGGESDYG